ncbi:unannotated protein [freshwater metagenome]|uniref:Unannotated protein n=1 Tax=freshwater metagenome TaxID=449393 RepID=A0A6J7EME1_9ZZZZ|nr:hypothetical protein [Actinomycetota bacterium]
MADSPRPPAARNDLANYSPFTSRALVLGGILAVLVVLYAVPLREYVQQRSQIAALQADKARTSAHITELSKRLEQWKDPAFVSAQARQRLQYVMPGEVSYVVLDPNSTPAQIATGRAANTSSTAWYTLLWQSVQVADAPVGK